LDESVKKPNPIRCSLWAIAVLIFCAGIAAGAESADKPQESQTSCVAVLEGCGLKAITQESTHFTVIAGGDRELATGEVESLETIYSGFLRNLKEDGFAPKKPATSLTWVVFAEGEEMDDYAEAADHADTTRLDGYYSPRTNRVAIVKTACGQSRDWEDTTGSAEHATVLGAATDGQAGHFRRVSHEAAHQISFNCGMLTRGVMYPLWVSEGVSTNFESDGPDAMKFAGANKPRAMRLATLARSGKLLSLGSLVRLVQVPPCTATEQDDYYAQAWGLFNFLYNHHRQEVRTYLAYMSHQKQGFRNGALLAGEFQSVFGTAAAMEAEWQDFAAGR
jgi:hypothetical protein